MKKILTIAVLLAGFAPAGLTQVQKASTPQKPARTGVLLLAHGGSAQVWNEEVRHVADQVDLSIPTEIAFGMATRSSMQAAVNRLADRGVTEIIAVPLFVSSHSSVIDSISYLLGLSPQDPEDLKEFAAMSHGGPMDHSAMTHDASMNSAAADGRKPVASPVTIRMASALDHHQIVANILADRAASISRNPAHEVIVLVAHGPVPEQENKLWLNDMELLGQEIGRQTNYAGIESLTLRDDADDPVRNAATKQLRQKVEGIAKAGNTALIVPLLLSYGGIEAGLRERLSGLTYRMPSQGLLPDPRIVSWVKDSVQSIAGPTVSHP